MATHRRGISATQWPVADLLRREGRPWPSLSPAARGIVVGSALLCSTVVAVSMAGEPAEHEPAPTPQPDRPEAAPPGSATSTAPSATRATAPGHGGPPPRTGPRTSGVLAGGPGVVLVPHPAPSRAPSRGGLVLPDLADGDADDVPVDGSSIVAGARDGGGKSA